MAKKICKIDDGEKPYKCNISTKELASEFELEYHEKINHTENPKAYKCDRCEKDFINLLSLKTHKRIHFKERSLTCKYCTKSFDNKDILDAHILKNHFEDVFKNKCTVCGLFQYSTSKRNLNSNVNRHMSMHSQPTYSHTSKRRQPTITFEPIKSSAENISYKRYLID